MKARSALMMALAKVIRERGTTQDEAAALFGVTKPRVSELVRGKINLFSLDTLIDMAATAGMAPMVRVSKPKAQSPNTKARFAPQAPGRCEIGGCVNQFLPQLGPLRNRAEKSDTFTDLLGVFKEVTP